MAKICKTNIGGEQKSLCVVYIQDYNESQANAMKTWLNNVEINGNKIKFTEAPPFQDREIIIRYKDENNESFYTFPNCCNTNRIHCEYNIDINNGRNDVKIINKYDDIDDVTDVRYNYGIVTKEIDGGRLRINVNYRGHSSSGNMMNHTTFSFKPIGQTEAGEPSYHYVDFTLSGSPTNWTYKDMFNGCKDLRTIEFPCKTAIINSRCCYGCNYLVDFSPKSSIQAIHESAFEGCGELTGETFNVTTYYDNENGELASGGTMSLNGLPLPNINSFFPNSLLGAEKLEGLTYRNTYDTNLFTNFNTTLVDLENGQANNSFTYLIVSEEECSSCTNSHSEPSYCKYNFRKIGPDYLPVINMTRLRYVRNYMFYRCLAIKNVVFDLRTFEGLSSSSCALDYKTRNSAKCAFGVDEGDDYDELNFRIIDTLGAWGNTIEYLPTDKSSCEERITSAYSEDVSTRLSEMFLFKDNQQPQEPQDPKERRQKVKFYIDTRITTVESFAEAMRIKYANSNYSYFYYDRLSSYYYYYDWSLGDWQKQYQYEQPSNFTFIVYDSEFWNNQLPSQ
jgi:hypothetical protein